MIKSEFEAESKKKAENRVEKLSRKNGFKVKGVDKKKPTSTRFKRGTKIPLPENRRPIPKKRSKKPWSSLAIKSFALIKSGLISKEVSLKVKSLPLSVSVPICWSSSLVLMRF